VYKDAPELIFRTVRATLPPNKTVDPLTPFYHFKMGTLPVWLVRWFIDQQKPSRCGNITLFFRAMHLIELLRAFVHDVVEADVIIDMDDDGPSGTVSIEVDESGTVELGSDVSAAVPLEEDSDEDRLVIDLDCGVPEYFEEPDSEEDKGPSAKKGKGKSSKK